MDLQFITLHQYFECRYARTILFVHPGLKKYILKLWDLEKCNNLKQNLKDLYIEEIMAPSYVQPMFDKKGNYPWHQFETITPSVFSYRDVTQRTGHLV